MPQTIVTAYANSELIDNSIRRFHTKRDSGTSTSGVSFQGIRPVGGGLKPSQVNDKLELDVHDIILAPGTTDDEIQLRIRRHFVKQAIDHIFPGVFDSVFGENQDNVCPMPQVQLAEIPETELEPLNDLPFDSYTEAGTEQVIDAIYCQGYKLQESDFYDKVFMLFTDQKTAENVRIMKFLHDEDGEFGYASKKWLLAFPSLMHMRMHALEMLLKCHFGGDPAKGGSLYNHLQFLGIPNVSESTSEFYSLEELAIQSYRARICGFLEEQFGIPPVQLRDHFKQLKPQDMVALIDQLVQNITNISNWNSFDPNFHKDQEVQAHYLFLRHSEPYFVLQHAIRAGDVGLLKRAISMLCLQFNGSGQSNYAYQMLHMIRYCIASTIPSTYQEALLINSITHARVFESQTVGSHPNTRPEQIQRVWELAAKMYENRSCRITPLRMVIYPAKNLAHEGRVKLSNDQVTRFNRKEVDKMPDDDFPEEDSLKGLFDVYIDTTLKL